MTLAIIYGGRSTEHEVSCVSAAGIAAALAPTDHDVILIGASRDGQWYLQPVDGDSVGLAIGRRDEARVAISPGEGLVMRDGTPIAVDCAIPVIHGTTGEDGVIQGALETAGVPYTGSGVLASALGMDKVRAKRLWEGAGLPVVDYRVLENVRPETARECAAAVADELVGALGLPLFVKPNAAGSSIGISRVTTRDAFAAAVARAAAVDATILVERGLSVREIETAVIGDEDAYAFPPGELEPSHDFYDYEAKYLDPDGARFAIPAAIDDATRERVMRLAVDAYRALGCEGYARVDLFLEHGTGAVYLNEINTIPGFTPISMYPKLAEAGGLAYADLILDLVARAMARAATNAQRDPTAR